VTIQSWYTIHTKPHKESHVRSYLESQGFEVFYPCIKVNPVNPRSSSIKPFFPCYLFVRADLEQIGTSAMRWIPGTIGLVEFDGTPVSVPTAIINELKARLKNMQLDVIQPNDSFKSGEFIRVISGPFKGFEGIFAGNINSTHRVLLLLDMLGRLVKTEIDAYAIESVLAN
jgi:transcription elongation factor/antiterminator RfaH